MLSLLSSVGGPEGGRQTKKIVSGRGTTPVQKRMPVPVSAEFDVCVGELNLPDHGEQLRGDSEDIYTTVRLPGNCAALQSCWHKFSNWKRAPQTVS